MRPAIRERQSAAERKLQPSGGISVAASTQRTRSLAAASSSACATRPMRKVQSCAEAQPPSKSTSKGPCPPRSVRGFSTGPAKAKISAAMASIRSARSHQGVRSASTSSSLRPRSRATPGKRARSGAGGTARSRSHRMGNSASARNTQGAVNPMGPNTSISAAPPSPRTAIKARAKARCLCDGCQSASPPDGQARRFRLCARSADPDSAT